MKTKQYKETINNVTYIINVCYYSDGNIHYKSYFLKGKRHNANGAAQTWYDTKGNITSKQYWLNDKYLFNIKTNAELKQYLKFKNF